MPKYTHKFVEEYDGYVGFGFDREVDEATLIRNRLSEADMEALFDMISQ